MPSRLLCSGGGVAVKALATVYLSDVTFENTHAREGGGVILVDGAHGIFSNVTFETCSADTAGAVGIFTGASLKWSGGRATNCCSHLPQSFLIII